MRKLFLLLAGCVFAAVGANAQYANHPFAGTGQQHKTVSHLAHSAAVTAAHHAARTTTPACIYTEDFGTGTTTTPPTNWSYGTIAGGTWHWAITGSTSTYTTGPLASTTANNGWMIFDSDSLGAVCGCAPSGYLQSPAYDFSGHPSVLLSFEELYRNYYDSSDVWVSTDNWATYTIYPVVYNNNTGVNTRTPNPATVHINISAAAANHSAVSIRFVSLGDAGGSYAWMIDDICLSELDPHDVGVEGSFMYSGDANAYSGSIYTTPLNEVNDSIYPTTFLTNFGANPESNVVVNAQIFKGSVSVYNKSITYNPLPVGAADSLIEFDGFRPSSVGNYTVAYSTTVTDDGEAANNVDTNTFSVSDSTWMINQGALTGSLYEYKSAAPTEALYNGVRFDVPGTTTSVDTITGFGVSFSYESLPTNPGATVVVQLYYIDQSATSWTYVGTSVARALTAADISDTSTVVWADFRSDPVASGGIAPFVLAPGTTYAAMVQISGVTTNLLVNTTAAPNGTGDKYLGYFGQSDTSSNTGGPDFGATAATGNPSDVPMVRLYTTNHASGVHNVATTNAIIGKAYPNPANTSVNVPFTTVNDGVVTVTLSNVIGQVIATQQINATGGKAMNATFATTGLPNGVYMYTVEANGQHTTSRVSVSH